MKGLLVLGILSLSLSAQTFNYVCEDDYKFSATLKGETLKIKLARQSTVLKHVPSASGVKYSDGKITLHNKKDQALLYLDDFIPFHCSSDFKLPEPKIVEKPKAIPKPVVVKVKTKSKTQTVVKVKKTEVKKIEKRKTKTSKSIFSASGNDPQWQLRLSKSKGHFLYDEGEAFNFRLPKRRESGDSVLYFYRGKKTVMMIELHNHHCFDTITKKEHAQTVSIKMNGRSFVGCGE